MLAGVGVAHQRSADPTESLDAVDLMAVACERAAPPSLLRAADVVLTPRGTWRDADPGRLLATRFGAGARTVLADIGVLQQTLLTRACAEVARGDIDVALVVGGESRHRDLRARLSGTSAPVTAQTGGEPDEVLSPEGEIVARVEVDAGFTLPAAQYAVIETAIRAGRGRTVDQHARDVADLWSRFSEVAAANPHAWNRDPVGVELLLHPSPRNPMLSTPYTKWHCSQWNVDQAAALLVCSADAASRHRVGRDRWVFPVAAVESNAMVPLSRRRDLAACPAARLGRAALRDLANRDPVDADLVDVYSCFPSAVEVQARELALPLGLDADRDRDRPLTVTGGMTFAGGPLNNYTYQALARMAELLRGGEGATGLLTCISGPIAKHGMSLWSSTPPPRGFCAADVSTEVAARTPTLGVTAAHDGLARVDGYTVVHARDGAPERAVVVATTTDGLRTVASSTDDDVVAALLDGEWVGRQVTLRGAELRGPA